MYGNFNRLKIKINLNKQLYVVGKFSQLFLSNLVFNKIMSSVHLEWYIWNAVTPGIFK